MLDGSIPQGEIERMIDESFKLMVSKPTHKKHRSIFLMSISLANLLYQ
jgi:predicted DNA-binding protein (MmcQ/YjbR family)